MKKGFFGSLLLVVIFGLAGCLSAPVDTVTQVSTIDALLAGVYDGHMACGELLKNGNFGIGTFDGLDGEMVVLDGTVYQVKADGRVYTPGPRLTTPFAAVVRFQPDRALTVEDPLSYDDLKKLLDKEVPDQNIFCGIRIDGRFSFMKTRSVPAQKKPYPTLVEVTKNQPVFEMTDVTGTIVGFRCPPYVKGINVAGYHLHFISRDRTSGGHILAFNSEDAAIRIDACNRFLLVLPKTSDAFSSTDLNIDRESELEKVESGSEERNE